MIVHLQAQWKVSENGLVTSTQPPLKCVLAQMQHLMLDSWAIPQSFLLVIYNNNNSNNGDDIDLHYYYFNYYSIIISLHYLSIP